MRELLSELESALAEGTQADAAQLREQMKNVIDSARSRLDGTRESIRARASGAVEGASDYVRENPWQTVTVVAGLALLTGWLLARGR
jgi:ElaB/YqjD/DUF883 family membrane-anchored ribosome-binding protein